MWEVKGEPWQHWRLEDSPDGAGYLLQSAFNRRFLTVNDDAEARWSPWLGDRHAYRSQQWVLALPHGLSPR